MFEVIAVTSLEVDVDFRLDGQTRLDVLNEKLTMVTLLSDRAIK